MKEPGSNSFFTISSGMPAGAEGLAAGAAPGLPAAGFAVPPEIAALTSRSTTRPCGPVPLTAAMSMPASLAMRRASGEAKTRSPAAWPFANGAAAGAAFGAWAGFSAGAAEAGSAAFGGGAAAGSVVFAEGEAAGVPFPAAPATAFASSPSAAMTPISWFTGTSAVPSGTTILASTPSSTASTSMVALSVSISAITSPDLMVSPSFFSHLARLPFSMVGDRAGMRMLVGM